MNFAINFWFWMACIFAVAYILQTCNVFLQMKLIITNKTLLERYKENYELIHKINEEMTKSLEAVKSSNLK
jgi:hypothetical protein